MKREIVHILCKKTSPALGGMAAEKWNLQPEFLWGTVRSPRCHTLIKGLKGKHIHMPMSQKYIK